MQYDADVRPRSSNDRFSILAGLTISLILVTLIVLGTSRAAWTATTESGSSSVSVGSLLLSDDDGGSALMNVTGLLPGESASQCIEVTYAASPDPNPVKLYSSSQIDLSGLGVWIDVTIEEGSGATYGSCTDFLSTSTIYSGDLALWGTKTAYATGVGAWDPASGTASKSYKFTVTLDASAPSIVQGAEVTGIEFTWETQA